MTRIECLPKWLDDCPNLFVKLIHLPPGIDFYIPKKASEIETVKVKNLNIVGQRLSQENVWRSWKVFSDQLCVSPVGYIPLLLDIDNEENDIEKTRILTKICVDLIDLKIKNNELSSCRVVFSGRKGFHIEIKPLNPIDNDEFRKNLLIDIKNLGFEPKGMNCFLDCCIDPVHDDLFVRLINSIYSWEVDNAIKKRRVIQLEMDEFNSTTVREIIQKSEDICNNN
jgi:hypothetical protein